MCNAIALHMCDTRADPPGGIPNLSRVQRVLMVTHTSYSVIVTYVEDCQQLIVQAVEPVKLTALVAGKIEVPILLDEYDFKLDDEFARRLGVAMLNLIALGQPNIEKYMNVTQQPIDELPGQSDTEDVGD
jgi:hypothetical protein